jgi:hypothetical protein
MEELDRRLLLGAAGLAGVAALAGRSKAGPLSPPAGAVASSGKTLTEVEPRTVVSATNTPGDGTAVFIISQSGSYKLGGNIAGVSGKHGVKITASDVSLDLCGFTVKGVAGSSDGINAVGGLRNTVVINGTVADFAGYGINNTASVSSRFADLMLTGNSSVALQAGTDSVIERVTTRAGAVGISAGDRSRLTACEARETVASGVGILAFQNCVLTSCVAVSCSGACIDAGNGTIVRDCNGSASATSHGIRLGYGASATGCVTNSNFLNGIEGTQRNKIVDCLATGNTQSGIRANVTSCVEGCFCESNTQCGILTDSGGFATIRGNTCHENGLGAGVNGAGIRVSNAGGSVIEGNSTVGNYRGIDVLSARNVVGGNRSAGNTNNDYSIVAVNSYGPIVNVTGVGDVTGTANANHPMANWRF